MNSEFVRFGLATLALAASFTVSAADGKLPFRDGDRIAFLGDSITQHGSDSPRGWVNLVERAIRAEAPEVAFVHAGVSGNKSSQMIVRYEGDVVHRKPNWMFFSCGVNDAPNGLTGRSRNRGLPLAAYKANVETILDWAREDGTTVIVLSQTPVLETPVDHAANRNLEAYNAVLKEAALKRGLTYLDPGAAIRAEIAKKADPEVLALTVDGTHLNDRGNAIYAEAVLNGLRRAAPAANGPVSVAVDFTRPAGPVKPLHGVNNAPVRPQKDAKVWEFEAAGIPYMRTHDTAGMWGGGHYVDIPNVFPNFDADENDPKNYDFAFTDAYLAAVVAAGTKVYYRLGVTIENYYYVKAYNIYPPKDFAKWARICEHVVRHYNEGWANGFKWNIEYWEIWNEPENPPMWQGTREQYFELYRVAANHLKRCFPNIKVGGYGGCGFYALDPTVDWEGSAFQKSFLTWFEDFCKFVTDEKTKAPLDFYSWHLYVKTSPRRIVTHAKYVRDTLDKAGLGATESHFNEWNYVGPEWDDMEGMRLQRGAACVGEAFCLMQRAPVDKALYYDALPSRSYCGLFHLVGRDKRTTTYHAFRLWNRLYRLGTSVESAADRPDFGVTAAAQGDARAVYLVNNSPVSRTVRLSLKGADGAAFEIARLDDAHDSEKAEPFDPSADLTLAPHQIVLLTTAAEAKAVDRGAERKVFAGQDAGH